MSAKSAGRVVIGGSTGFMGQYLQQKYRGEGREVVTVSRSGADLRWGDQEGIDAAIDGADLVIGLAGKSVNCRYTAENRAEIFRSRVDTTRSISMAIAEAARPPALWVNSSTATIYRHAEDHPMTEITGEIGTGFSVEVAKAWESALYEQDLPDTRRVAFRSAIVLGDGGVLGTLRGLALRGLGGAQHDGWWPVSRARRAAGTGHFPGARRGTQRFSWVHIADVARMMDFLEQTPSVNGPVNAAATGPVTNTELMAAVRDILGVRFGPSIPRWALELGAVGIRTETELILKSRWVLPEKLLSAGFDFQYPELKSALQAAFVPSN